VRSTATLHEALGESQRLGFLGNRPIDEVVEHAKAFVVALAGVSGTVLDLGSGGGVPGLVIAAERRDLDVTLLDRRAKRTDFLERVVRRLGWSDRVRVVNADAERIGAEHLFEPFDAVVARGFGPPALTLRVAVELTRPGGRVVISEPPDGDRWSADEVDDAGVYRLRSNRRVACFVRLS
jgi:16S rRNA (guanine527-N7)-methyltransferase